MNPDDERLLASLPHRPPFRFLSDGIDLRDGVRGEANWRLSGTEPFLAGHFPGQPLVPGVLIVEALAQLSGLILFTPPVAAPAMDQKLPPVPARLAHVDIRFQTAVAPPVNLRLQSTLVRSLGGLRQFDVQARVGEEVSARGQLTLALTEESEDQGLMS